MIKFAFWKTSSGCNGVGCSPEEAGTPLGDLCVGVRGDAVRQVTEQNSGTGLWRMRERELTECQRHCPKRVELWTNEGPLHSLREYRMMIQS